MGSGQITGHALVVGCPGDNLEGVDYDVAAMKQMLQGRGIAVDVRTGESATRAGILQGYDELIAKARPGQPAVFYYTGHGWYSLPDTESGSAWQGICPTDLNATTTNDFRGITSWELSIKQVQLTERTKNVTVILDCCHAARMSRDAAASTAVCRALPHPVRAGFAEHFLALKADYGPAYSAVEPSGNPDAVRLVACRHDESAFEYPLDGVYRGAFTEALLDVLQGVGDAPVSWAAIADAIRERVHRRFLIQRPDIEGPAHRRIFSEEPGQLGEVVPISARPEGLRLGAGQLMRVTPGDVYGVMPPDSREYRAADAIADIEVTDTFATYSAAVVRDWRNGHGALPQGAVALPIEKQFVRRPVKIQVPDGVRPAVEAEIAAIRTLRLAGPDEPAALATLRVADNSLTLEDPMGPLFAPKRFPEGLREATASLANLAAAQALRELEGEHGVLATDLEIEWGTVDHGAMRRMPDAGAVLGLQDRIYVKIRSRAEDTLYAHIFNIGIRSTIKLVTGNAAPAGCPLTTEEPEFVLGRYFDGTLPGEGLSWARDVPRGALPRLDELVVIITTACASLQGLETGTGGQRGATRGPGSQLQDLLSQLQDGLPRSLPAGRAKDGFYVKRLSYWLYPREAAMADVPFEIATPLYRAAAQVGDAWQPPRVDATSRSRSGRIAIRLAELAVPDQLAVSGLRLDALICTRSAAGSEGFATWTQRYAAVKPGEHLDFESAVVFQGAVTDFVEICLWVSSDTGASLELSELLAQRGDRAAIEDAARALVIAGNDSQSPWIPAVGASAALIRAAHEALVAGTGQPVGLYRAAFLARDRFGAGRSPAGCVYRIRGHAFAVHIDATGPEHTERDTVSNVRH